MSATHLTEREEIQITQNLTVVLEGRTFLCLTEAARCLQIVYDNEVKVELKLLFWHIRKTSAPYRLRHTQISNPR